MLSYGQGIHTAPNYRRRGLATVAAAATVDYALSHGFSMVGWHCNDENLGSIGTAEKIGFTRERDYTIYDLFLGEAVAHDWRDISHTSRFKEFVELRRTRVGTDGTCGADCIG